MREFVTAAQNAVDGEEKPDIEFLIDGEQVKALYPGDGQYAVLMASTSRNSSQEEQVAGYINFFVSLLDDRSRTHVIQRLLDNRDPFGVAQIRDILEGLMEEWSGRPTQSSSGSTASPSSDGPKSTPSTPALT